MDGCVYVGLLLIAGVCVLGAFFRPQTRKSRFLCALLLTMGGMSVVMPQESVGLAVAEALLGGIMTVCALAVMLREAHDRRVAHAERRHRAEIRRRHEAAYRQALSAAVEESRRVA
ncbi:MAG: hypothetical protein LKE53_10245 [Oscillospiraceae bacterium]|jgi:mannose/fructose/N-acetylgalactosamine-specific phosphotransferase system component IIC|nr:hypothetical protein [Oscillospiraceae bacterium]MDD3260596.1 hypothetical protein [Oscillospiraceae bacterium]